MPVSSSDVSSKLESILEFIIEVEKLKAVQRKTKPVGLNRFENSAEHSWHVCLSALMLKDYAEKEIDIERVLKMLLIHDLGEIDAGDTIIYQSETVENKNLEEQGVKRVLALLPKEQGKNYLALWREFEQGESVDAQYARAIDRVPPILHNLHGDYHSWKGFNISKEKVLEVNSRIQFGIKSLWLILKGKISNAFDSGEVH